MDIKSLMVGDWVYNKHHGKNIRLTQYDFFTHTHNEFGEQKLAPFAKPTFGRDLEPIPLTPEILEKNGMHLYNRKTNSLMEECNHSDIFEEDDNYRVELSLDYDGSIRWTINGDEYTIMPLDYVHQLQHALRLCSISKEIEL